MAGYFIDLQSSHREEQNGSHTVIVEITGLPTIAKAQAVSDWMRKVIQEHANELGTLVKT